MHYKIILPFLLAFCINLCYAQQKDSTYTKQWEIIDTLIIAKQLPKSALEKVISLYNKAKREQQNAQVIKCLLYQLSLAEKITDNNINQSINGLKKEITLTTQAAQLSILKTILANQYNQQYNNARWTIFNRKNTNAIDVNDINTWSANDFEKTIDSLFEQALKPVQVLQQTNTQFYEVIILKGSDSIHPYNLYDLLSAEAIDYYKNSIANSRTAKPLTTITDINCLGLIDEFMRADFTRQKTVTKEWKIIQLYQQLLRNHQNDIDKTVFTRFNIDRIEWVNTIIRIPEKEIKYKAALLEVTKVYSKTNASVRAWYLLAENSFNLAQTYSPDADTTHRYAYNQSLDYIEAAKKVYPQNIWERSGLYRLKIQITTQNNHTEVEKINVPDKAFRVLVQYRNIDTLFARIIKIDPKKLLIYPYSENYWQTLTNLTAIKDFAQPLPATNDHQQHSVEIKMDALANGNYLLLTSTNKQFIPQKEQLSASFFSVSNFTFFRENNRVFVRDLTNGKAITDASVNIYWIENNYTENRRLATALTTKTDENGSFNFNNANDNGRSYFFEISKRKDYLLADDERIYMPYENSTENDEVKATFEKNSRRVFFFTDRSLYRPGQLVYFKGIAITKEFATKRSKLITDKNSFKVFLRDVNGKAIDSASFSLNEYGSFAGQFKLPQQVLTGQFNIEVPFYNRSSTYFSVEEYKRPAFSVQFTKATKSYQLNDSIYVKGTAFAYAGNVINGAKVAYTVRQNTSINIPFYKRSYPPYQQSNIELLSGETMTDEKGNFTISFKAVYEDTSSDIETNLNYTIEASITDLNGETRMGNTTAIASNKGIKLSLNNSAIIEKNAFTKITAYAFGNNGQKVTTPITITLFKAKSPEQAIRKRFWSRPDQFILSEKEFRSNFPYDEYNKELDQSNWLLTPILLTKNIIQSDTLAIETDLIEAGVYKIVATAIDSLGKQVSADQFVQVYDRAQKIIPFAAYEFNTTNYLVAQTGDTAKFINGSSFNNLPIVRKIKREYSKADEYSYLSISGMEELSFVLKERDRGAIIITDAYVYHGRFYTKQYRVTIPFTNKVLAIKYGTHRTIYEPGSAEKFTVEVSGEKGEQRTAELLTGMYDASLDALKPHNWYNPGLWQSLIWSNGFVSQQFKVGANFQNPQSFPNIEEDYFQRPVLASDGESFWGRINYYGVNRSKSFNGKQSRLQLEGTLNEEVVVMSSSAKQKRAYSTDVSISGNSDNKEEDYNKVFTPLAINNSVAINGENAPPPQIRKNFNETAFFFPQLQADSSGKFSFSFTFPDAVTQWKWMSVAHTKDLSFGSNSETILTQKTLMVQPNAPRFVREGDNIEFSTKIANLSDKELTGTVSLELLDASTNKSVDGWFQNVFPQQYFTAGAGQSTVVKFPLLIPYSFNKPLTWRIVAKAGNYSDGEENIIPVLSSRILVTESLPILLQKDTTQQFSFTKLINNKSESLTHQSLTVEYTTNPIWNTVQALPYLMEYPYECAEQTFNRVYANLLGAYIINKSARIKSIFELWKKDSTALKSNLEKNEELKQVLLQETPWVLQATNEAQQKQQIALLFDAMRLSEQTEKWIKQLEQIQLPSGAFPWFTGGYADNYITNYILTGIGKLKRLGALTPDIALRLRPLLVKAIQYADNAIGIDYNYIKKLKPIPVQQQINTNHIQYLFMRSFFGDIANQQTEAYQYFYAQGKKYWTKQNTYYQAMLALILYRTKEEKFAVQNILPSLLENTIINNTQGMYWKTAYANSWYQSPIIHQSMLISCFGEINEQEKNKPYTQSVNAMRTWLILNKQTNNWRTTIATADACYALLLNGSDWLNSNKTVQVQLGALTINSSNEKTEAGTGYLKKRIDGAQVVPEMGNITVTVKGSDATFGSVPTRAGTSAQPSYGAVYWQYFEDMNKITPATTPLSLTKKLLVERNSANGKILMEIKENDAMKVGDKITVQMILKTDRDMEYLHLKDLRAAATEPLNVLSGYKWKENLGYYESTKDVSSNFFISYLPKGTNVFTYELVATHVGIFSAGIASIQCMYAPEFTSHSGGINLRIQE